MYNLEKIIMAMACISSSLDHSKMLIHTNSQDVYRCPLQDLEIFATNWTVPILEKYKTVSKVENNLLESIRDELHVVKDSINQPQGGTSVRFCQKPGLNTIYLGSGSVRPFEVNCENNRYGENWMVISRRYENSPLFRDLRNDDIRNGFGHINGEFFLGLRKIHAITNSHLQELLMVTLRPDGVEHFERYANFALAGESKGFKVNLLGAYTGDMASEKGDTKKLRQIFQNEGPLGYMDTNKNQVFYLRPTNMS